MCPRFKSLQIRWKHSVKWTLKTKKNSSEPESLKVCFITRLKKVVADGQNGAQNWTCFIAWTCLVYTYYYANYSGNPIQIYLSIGYILGEKFIKRFSTLQWIITLLCTFIYIHRLEVGVLGRLFGSGKERWKKLG